MNVLDTAYHEAQDYPGGAAALAVRMGKPASTLQKELRGDAGYKLGMADAMKLDAFLGGNPILTAFAADAGYMVLQLPDAGATTTCSITAVSKLMHEAGDVLRTVADAVADGHVSDNEVSACRREIAEVMRALQAVDASLVAQNRASKPANIRGAA